MKKINSLTSEQWDWIDNFKEEFIESQTDQLTIDEVTGTVYRMYDQLGLKRPIVLLAPSPLAVSKWDFIVRKIFLSSQIRDQLDNQIHSQIHSQIRDHLNSQLRGQLDDKLRVQLRNELNDQMRYKLEDQLSVQLRNHLTNQLHEQLESHPKIRLGVPLIGIWRKSWSAWYIAGDYIGARLDKEKMGIYNDWCRCCGVVVVRDGICVVSQNPKKINWDDRELHCHDGPSVEWEDGYRLWSIEGNLVNEQIVMTPESQTIEDIRLEENEEIKRIRIERFGVLRYVEETNAEVLDYRRNYIECTYEILAVVDGDHHLITFCPSTGRRYFIKLADRASSCEEAQRILWNGNFNIVGRT